MEGRSRRRLLAGLGVAATGAAGCLDSSALDTAATETTVNGSATTGTDDERGSTDADDGFGERGVVGDAFDVDGRTVSLRSARATRFLVTLLSGTHPSVSADRERQYVVVEFDVAGEDPMDAARRACELRVDDDAVAPVSEVVWPFEDRTHLAFSLPLSVDVDDLVLAWVGESATATWRLPDAVATALESPPDFEVRSFSVPSTANGDEVEVSFAVANVGAGDGEFLAELGTKALSDQGEVRVDVPRGETRTVTEIVGLVPSVGDQPILLDWGWDALERTVAVPTTTE